MLRVARALALPCALAAAALVPGRALADDDVDAARRAFVEGVARFQRGDYEAARAMFVQADAAHHAPVIRYNLARAEEKLGLAQAAVDDYEDYVGEAGEKGEFTSAATIAIAQIKTRSTHLRIETKPSGARASVDGRALADATPATTLLGAGHHTVVIDGDGGWHEERPVDVQGRGDAVTLVIERAVVPGATPPPRGSPSSASPPGTAPSSAPPGASAASASPSPSPTPSPGASSPAPSTHGGEPDGLVGGAAFVLIPYYLLGVTTSGATNQRPTGAAAAGASAEIGVEITPTFEFLGRGWFAIGPEGKPTTAFALGPALSFKVLPMVWLGATFIGGELETRANDARYGTDLVFGAQAEASLVVLSRWYGEWLISAQPGFLLTQIKNDNTALLFPLSFGLRAF